MYAAQEEPGSAPGSSYALLGAASWHMSVKSEASGYSIFAPDLKVLMLASRRPFPLPIEGLSWTATV